MTLRIPKWLLLSLGALIALAAVGLGVWYFAIRDTGPTQAELREQEMARERAKARRLARECRDQTDELMAAIDDLAGRLQGLGLSYADYGAEVGDASSAYQALGVGRMKFECLSNVGAPLERSLNSYIQAGNVWGDCFEDFDCDVDSIDPQLQDHWAKAGVAASQAKRGLSSMLAVAN